MGEGRVSGPSNAKGSAREMRAPGDASVRDGLRRTEQGSAGIEELVPGWLGAMDQMRSAKGLPELSWPDWCLLPMAGPLSLALEAGVADATSGFAGPAGMMAALYAWCQGKAIWQVDADLADALVRTDMSGDIPVEVLYRLPMWGVYFLAPVGCPSWPAGLLGALAHLNWEPGTGRPELQILLDYGGEPQAVPLSMTSKTVAGMLADADRSGREVARRLGVQVDQGESLPRFYQ